MLSNKEKSAKLLLGILRWGTSIPEQADYEKKVQKRLKVLNEYDSYKIRSCVDLIEDTEFAIRNFCEYGLEKFTPNGNYGRDLCEMYLKLYGVLNAVYLQAHSIIELLETMNTVHKNEKRKLLKTHKILELRNIAGAHTINFEDKSDYMPANNRKNFFRIVQSMLTPKGENILAVSVFEKSRKFNLYELILDYNRIAEKLFFESVSDYYKLVLPHGNKTLDSWILEFKLLEFEHYDYKSLYKNDFEYQEYRKKELTEFEAEIQSDLLEFDELSEQFKNEILGLENK